MKKLKKQTLYIIALRGIEEFEFKLVSRAVLDWIVKGTNLPPTEAVKEWTDPFNKAILFSIPPYGIESSAEKVNYLSSPDNDRALSI